MHTVYCKDTKRGFVYPFDNFDIVSVMRARKCDVTLFYSRIEALDFLYHKLLRYVEMINSSLRTFDSIEEYENDVVQGLKVISFSVEMREAFKSLKGVIYPDKLDLDMNFKPLDCLSGRVFGVGLTSDQYFLVTSEVSKKYEDYLANLFCSVPAVVLRSNEYAQEIREMIVDFVEDQDDFKDEERCVNVLSSDDIKRADASFDFVVYDINEADLYLSDAFQPHDECRYDDVLSESRSKRKFDGWNDEILKGMRCDCNSCPPDPLYKWNLFHRYSRAEDYDALCEVYLLYKELRECHGFGAAEKFNRLLVKGGFLFLVALKLFHLYFNIGESQGYWSHHLLYPLDQKVEYEYRWFNYDIQGHLNSYPHSLRSLWHRVLFMMVARRLLLFDRNKCFVDEIILDGEGNCVSVASVVYAISFFVGKRVLVYDPLTLDHRPSVFVVDRKLLINLHYKIRRWTADIHYLDVLNFGRSDKAVVPSCYFRMDYLYLSKIPNNDSSGRDRALIRDAVITLMMVFNFHHFDIIVKIVTMILDEFSAGFNGRSTELHVDCKDYRVSAMASHHDMIFNICNSISRCKKRNGYVENNYRYSNDMFDIGYTSLALEARFVKYLCEGKTLFSGFDENLEMIYDQNGVQMITDGVNKVSVDEAERWNRTVFKT